MKKLIYLIVLTLILGLVLTGCLLSNVGQVPATEQSGVAYLTKALPSLPSGLVGLWHFDTDANDSTANQNDGTFKGNAHLTTTGTGYFGEAVRFDGSGDYVEIDSDASIMPVTLTVEAWIQPGKIGSRQCIVSKWDGGGDASYSVELTGGGKFLFYLHNGTKTECIIGTTTVTIGNWYHVVGTYDGSIASLYVNGDLEAGPTTLVAPMTTSNVPLVIGAHAGRFPYNYFLYYFNGLIDEVRIWNIALSSEDIFNLPAILVEKTCPISAYVGGIITYDYTVRNTGKCILYDVLLLDDVIGPIELDGLGESDDLAVGEEATGTVKYDVPSDVVSPLVNIATATGTSPFGVTVTGDDSCSVVIYHEETAWAYGVDVAKPNNEVPGNSSNAWGWTNLCAGEDRYLLDLYAAAGQNNTEIGFQVGTVTVNLVDGCVKVDYLITNTNQNYRITEAHLWVGNALLPTVKQGKKDVLTSAPGQFPNSLTIAEGVKSATFDVCGIKTDLFYVAAHAVVEWCEEEEE